MEEFINDKKIIIFKITEASSKIYDRTRRCWKCKIERAKKAEYVLSVINGLVVGVFKPNGWYYTCNDNECKKDKCKKWICKRIGFIGVEAERDIQKKYLHKYIPDELLGQANPIRYLNI
jgi:hypothetical protein